MATLFTIWLCGATCLILAGLFTIKLTEMGL